MAASSVVYSRKNKRELVIVFQFSNSDLIRSFTLSYMFLFQLFLVSIFILLIGILYFLVNVVDLQSADRSITSEDAGILILDSDRSSFKDEISNLIKSSEILLERQKSIHRYLIASDMHIRHLEFQENMYGSLLEVKKSIKVPETAFIPARYAIRRFNSHAWIIRSNMGFARFFYNNLFPLPYRRPLRSKLKITSGFGFRRRPGRGPFGPIEFHRGLDINAAMGEAVYATASGKVVFVRYSRKGYGNRIMIEHHQGYTTLYAHMKSLFVQKNQYVRAGEIIGEAGSSGYSTGPHLHYEIRKRSNAVNPYTFFTH